MGVLVIGGLISSTLLTMVVVPVAYVLVEDAGQAVARLGRRIRRLAPAWAARRIGE
jgi:HAE1 family hydrophobic/amphiphilic exporter-1